MDIESTHAQLASREVEHRKTVAKCARANLLEENFGKENHAQKCNLARPENVIPTAVKTWQCVLASLFPEAGEEEHFQKVSKRVSLETCEKTDAGPDGVNGHS